MNMGVNSSFSLCSQVFWAQNHKWNRWIVGISRFKFLEEELCKVNFITLCCIVLAAHRWLWLC